MEKQELKVQVIYTLSNLDIYKIRNWEFSASIEDFDTPL